MSSTDDRPAPAPRRAGWRWLAGVVVGGSGALLLLVAGTLGAVAWALLALWLMARPDRVPALAGLAVGFGGAILALLLRAGLACRPDECVGPDMTGWIVLASGCLGAGLLTTMAAARARSV